MEALIAQKESKYNKLVEEYKSGALDNEHIGYVKRLFKDYGTYKDAAMYVKQIEECYDEEMKQLCALRDEKRDILKSFNELGLLSQKKKAALKFRLKEVNDKIEKMENRMNGKS